jgi:uncharacterized protein
VHELIAEYRKWPDSLHYRTRMTLLGVDEAGTWAGSRGGAFVLRGDGTHLALSADAVTLFPVSRSWAARWHAKRSSSGRAARFRCYVDIATPATISADVLHLVDLDLDVALTWGGEVIGLDEDEFARNQVALGYPDLIVRRATDAFEEVKQAMSRQQFPFDGTADRYTSSWFTQSQLR